MLALKGRGMFSTRLRQILALINKKRLDKNIQSCLFNYRRANVLSEASAVLLAVHDAGDIRRRDGGEWAIGRTHTSAAEEHPAACHRHCHMVMHFLPTLRRGRGHRWLAKHPPD